MGSISFASPSAVPSPPPALSQCRRPPPAIRAASSTVDHVPCGAPPPHAVKCLRRSLALRAAPPTQTPLHTSLLRGQTPFQIGDGTSIPRRRILLQNFRFRLTFCKKKPLPLFPSPLRSHSLLDPAHSPAPSTVYSPSARPRPLTSLLLSVE